MRNMICTPNRTGLDIDRFINGFFGNVPFDSEGTRFMPRVNVVEDDDQINLTFELPGLEKGDIRVVVEKNILTVSGERKLSEEKKEKSYVRSEIRGGSFSRSFTLPDSVLTDSIEADYKNGLLVVSLTKKEEQKPREIDVKVR